MSKFVAGVFGAIALVVSMGAAGYAVGNSLAGTQAQIAATAQTNLVNRAAKADRPAGIKTSTGQTIVTQLTALDGTSVAIRIPRQTVRQESSAAKAARRPVACEAPASVLTEIAQHLESGRCVT